MNIEYIARNELLEELSSRDSASLEFVLLVTGALNTSDDHSLHSLLE